jgi:hypothetical protein
VPLRFARADDRHETAPIVRLKAEFAIEGSTNENSTRTTLLIRSCIRRDRGPNIRPTSRTCDAFWVASLVERRATGRRRGGGGGFEEQREEEQNEKNKNTSSCGDRKTRNDELVERTSVPRVFYRSACVEDREHGYRLNGARMLRAQGCASRSG